MNDKELITINDSLTLLQDDKRVFLIQGNGYYMTAKDMKALATKMLDTADKYGAAIEYYNDMKDIPRILKNAIERR